MRRRTAILAAARQVFGEMGYDGASFDDVVRRADLPASAVQQAFPDKEAVFRTLVEESVRRLRTRVRAARDRASTLEEFVGGPFRAFFGFVAQDPMAFELLRQPAVLRALLEEPTLGATVAELHEDLDAAVARGDLPPIDLAYLAAAMAGVAVEVALRMVERKPVDADGAAAFVTRLFLGGLDRLCEPPRSARPAGRRARRRTTR